MTRSQRRIICVLSIILFVLIYFMIRSFDGIYEMPYVLLGGQSLYMPYTDEAFTARSGGGIQYKEYPLVDSDFNPIQIGDILIYQSSDVEKAIDTYAGTAVCTKELQNGQIISSYRTFEEDSVLAECYNCFACTGKICYYVPSKKVLLSFAHPLNNNLVYGVAYGGTSIETYEGDRGLAVRTIRNETPRLLGKQLFQNDYGVAFQYDDYTIDESNLFWVQIAKKKEVEIGDAIIYTDYGKGLNTYKIRIVAVDLVSSSKNDIVDDEFLFEVIDERLIEDGITNLISGMSGSPIIQNGKLVGCAGYSRHTGVAVAVYAESSYNALMKDLEPTTKSISLEKNPKVILGDTPVEYFIKESGSMIYVADEGYGLQNHDIILCLNDSLMFYGVDWEEQIELQHEQNPGDVKLTVLRDGHFVDVILAEDQNPAILNYDASRFRTGYITMIDPKTLKCAIGNAEENYYDINVLSGVIIDLNLDDYFIINNCQNIIGSVSSIKTGVYGTMISDDAYSSDDYIKVAFKDEIQDGPAQIVLHIEENDGCTYHIDVRVLKTEYGLYIINDSPFFKLKDYGIAGLPIIQNGKLIGSYQRQLAGNIAVGYYAIDMYNEMMSN